MRERLQKIVARAGVASRRAAEELVAAGRVRVNGRVVSELGAQADPFADRIEVDGRQVLAEDPVYVVLHKPRDVVSTLRDPEGRPTVADLVRQLPGRVYPIGRLDFATSGVLLLTNDGETAHGLLHPRRGVPKTYVVKVRGIMQPEDLERWRTGVELEDGRTLPAEVRLVRHEEDRTWIEVTIQEGRNQQIRRMGEATGFFVMRLARTSFAGISSEGLRPGQWRPLSRDELVDLREAYGVPKRVRGALTTGGVQGKVVQRGDERPERRGPARRGAAGARARSVEERRPPRTAPGEDRRPRPGGPTYGEPTYGEEGPPRRRPTPRDDRRPPQGDRPAPRAARPPRDDRAPLGDRPRARPLRDDRPPQGDRPRARPPRDDRHSPRADRPPRGDRPPARPPRDDRPPRADRPPQGDRPRPARPPRDDRPPQGDRPRARPPRDDRPPRADRPPQGDRPRAARPPRADRPPQGDRPRPARPPRDDRPPPGDRPRAARPPRDDRPPRAAGPRAGGPGRQGAIGPAPGRKRR